MTSRQGEVDILLINISSMIVNDATTNPANGDLIACRIPPRPHSLSAHSVVNRLIACDLLGLFMMSQSIRVLQIFGTLLHDLQL